MANILTTTEAAHVLRCETSDTNMLDLLPQVDAYIEMATGRDWTADTTIHPIAKAAARMLLVVWHENPGMMANGVSSLNFGFAAALSQLEALKLQLDTAGIPDVALTVLASMPADGSIDIAVTASVVVIFSRAMASGATSAAAIKTASGDAVASTNSLDATKKILTLDPTGSLAAATQYQVILTACPDSYGQTITKTLRFTTA